MAQIAPARRLLLSLAPGLLLIFAVGCSPAGIPAPIRLPTPRAWITPAATPATLPATAPAAAPTPPPDEPELMQLTRQLFGDKQIERIAIPALQLESGVVPVGWHVNAGGDSNAENIEWDSPYQAVGWMITSALPDQAGNTVLYGHNNMYTSIFKDLDRLAPGDLIYLTTGQATWTYQVSQVKILPILSAGVDQQAKYLSYLDPTPVARLTLISCWPPISNTHRVIVIADRQDPP
jgi:LPXTG-site transpeptidase (sortase) family protein